MLVIVSANQNRSDNNVVLMKGKLRLCEKSGTKRE